jgi:hypothetical protein
MVRKSKPPGAIWRSLFASGSNGIEYGALRIRPEMHPWDW